MTDRESDVTDAFVALADPPVTDGGGADLLVALAGHAASLLAAAAAGVVLADARGRLAVAAASTEDARALAAFEIGIDEGPDVDAVRGGAAVACADVADGADGARRWPRFAAASAGAGFRAVHGLPMRRGDETVGVLAVFHRHPGALVDPDRRLGQALADAATSALLQGRAHDRARELTAQLQSALTSRIVIEQAKGVLSALTGLSPDESFARLRVHARSRGERLPDLCRGVVDGTVDANDVVGSAERR